MSRIYLVLVSAVLFCSGFHSYILDEVRANYNKYASDKEVCRKAIAELYGARSISSTHLAYYGSLKTIWANHVFNPVTKLNTFEEGRQNIEQAIHQEPENVELRFIRLSVQRNAPSLLGYNRNVEEDSEFIRKNVHQINSTIVRRNIENILRD